MSKLKLFLYDCDMGQGSTEALSLARAKIQAVADAGRLNNVRNVRRATPEEFQFRKSMGGS